MIHGVKPGKLDPGIAVCACIAGVVVIVIVGLVREMW